MTEVEDHATTACSSCGRGCEFRRIALESVIVAILGLGLGLAANLASPRGLSLTRDYFPGGNRPLLPPPVTTNATATGVGTNAVSELQAVIARLKEKGLQPVEDGEVMRLYRDPRYELEAVVFIDARDDRHYQEGHIPGALQFDHYRPEHYLPTVLPVCQSAAIIVVYCTGGNCEDSEFAARTLQQAGVPADRLFVYAAGMNGWVAQGQPVEVGARKSGQMRPQTKP